MSMAMIIGTQPPTPASLLRLVQTLEATIVIIAPAPSQSAGLKDFLVPDPYKVHE